MRSIGGIRMLCPECMSQHVFTDEGYDTIYRCYNCGHVGNKEEFKN